MDDIEKVIGSKVNVTVKSNMVKGGGIQDVEIYVNLYSPTCVGATQQQNRKKTVNGTRRASACCDLDL